LYSRQPEEQIMKLDKVLEEVAGHARSHIGKGRIATYIPALAAVPTSKFGIAVHTVGGEIFCLGDAGEAFSIQSISKVFTLTLAITLMGDEIWQRVGREPSGNKFNSLVQLEYEKGIPRNPFINAGALVIADMLVSRFDNPKQALLDYMHVLTGDFTIRFDETVAHSEADTGFVNRALANFLKGNGNLDNSVDTVLDLYFHQCSIAMTCSQLAKASLHLANRGLSTAAGESILQQSEVKRINALMLTCGLYDAVGEFAYRVGLPAKSGVGGGIIAVLPGEYSVAVWSPELDPSGNSLAGGVALEYLTTLTGRSVF
jgi:glutaminase